jgi:predicted flap endonuclease-1-like 5' DNA nuclease
MNAPKEPLRSKGLAMVAAYRAERLSQRSQLRASPRQSPAAPPAPEPAKAASPAPPGSVPANLVSLEMAERQAESASPTPEPICDPPLAEMGFGPGMLIRLSQIGVHTTAELAQADAAHLRAELGEISRLINVETWIETARQHTKTRRA